MTQVGTLDGKGNLDLVPTTGSEWIFGVYCSRSGDDSLGLEFAFGPLDLRTENPRLRSVDSDTSENGVTASVSRRSRFGPRCPAQKLETRKRVGHIDPEQSQQTYGRDEMCRESTLSEAPTRPPWLVP